MRKRWENNYERKELDAPDELRIESWGPFLARRPLRPSVLLLEWWQAILHVQLAPKPALRHLFSIIVAILSPFPISGCTLHSFNCWQVFWPHILLLIKVKYALGGLCVCFVISVLAITLDHFLNIFQDRDEPSCCKVSSKASLECIEPLSFFFFFFFFFGKPYHLCSLWFLVWIQLSNDGNCRSSNDCWQGSWPLSAPGMSKKLRGSSQRLCFLWTKKKTWFRIPIRTWTNGKLQKKRIITNTPILTYSLDTRQFYFHFSCSVISFKHLSMLLGPTARKFIVGALPRFSRIHGVDQRDRASKRPSESRRSKTWMSSSFRS